MISTDALQHPADTTFACQMSIRDAELESVRHLFQRDNSVLDLGGGSGYQARRMADWGCDVVSIDIPAREPTPETYYSVQDYDGHHIPAPDGSFDIVFSSNTLEHIRHLHEILIETRRVLKPGGVAIHIVPSPAWRFWASVAFPFYAAGYVLGMYRIAGEAQAVKRSVAHRGRSGTMLRALMAPFRAHGEYPNAISELYYYSSRRWSRVFRDAGFVIEYAGSVGLFYTPYKLFNRTITMQHRRTLARLAGSACTVFAARKAP